MYLVSTGQFTDIYQFHSQQCFPHIIKFYNKLHANVSILEIVDKILDGFYGGICHIVRLKIISLEVHVLTNESYFFWINTESDLFEALTIVAMWVSKSDFCTSL